MIVLTLNWFGMAVHDVPAASDFYSQRLGFSFLEDETNSLWRQFQTRCMTFELFQAHPQRLMVNAWGDGQAFRPFILVDKLSAAIDMLQSQNISFSQPESSFGKILEMVGPEKIRWSLMESTDIQIDWAHPTIGGIELKAVNLDAQKAFYTEILGMTLERGVEGTLLLSQPDEMARLLIHTGGVFTHPPAPAGEEKPAYFYPIWISFETQDVKHANVWLKQQNAVILHPLTYHEDWNGTDIILADADGNAVQVVQYGKVDGLEHQ